MKIAEIMTTQVVSVDPGMPLKQVAGLLVEHRISGVPVCSEVGEVLGIVSEADILWKELGLNPRPGGIIEWILDAADADNERISARTAADAMTSPVHTIGPNASVSEAARLMIELRINRLPVVEDGLLVGLVARSDLVRAFTRSDAEIAREIREDVLLRTLWIDPAEIDVRVERGKVTIAGEVDNRSTAEIVEAYVRRTPGVVEVEAHMTWRLDDLSRRTVLAAGRLPHRV